MTLGRKISVRWPFGRDARAQRELAKAYDETFSGERGRRVLADIMRRAFSARTTLAAQTSEAALINEGRRALAFEIAHLAGLEDEQLALSLATDEMETSHDGRNDDDPWRGHGTSRVPSLTDDPIPTGD